MLGAHHRALWVAVVNGALAIGAAAQKPKDKPAPGGKGKPESLMSASHGAGRRMSRTKAKTMYTWNAVRKDLEQKGVRVLSAGADEVPGVYKNIEDVMRAQQDLVEIVARFDPKIVKMCGDGSKAED